MRECVWVKQPCIWIKSSENIILLMFYHRRYYRVQILGLKQALNLLGMRIIGPTTWRRGKQPSETWWRLENCVKSATYFWYIAPAKSGCRKVENFSERVSTPNWQQTSSLETIFRKFFARPERNEVWASTALLAALAKATKDDSAQVFHAGYDGNEQLP